MHGEAEKIATQARQSLNPYCLEECKGYCCRSSHLVLDEKQLDLVLGPNRDNYAIKKLDNKKFSISMKQNCPALMRDIKCRIHQDPNRPKTCKDFPLFIKEKTILLSRRCPGVMEGKLYPFTKHLQLLGYKILFSSPDFEPVDF